MLWAMIVNGSGRFHCGGARIIACNVLGICTDTVMASTKKQAGKLRGRKNTVPRIPANQLNSLLSITWRYGDDLKHRSG